MRIINDLFEAMEERRRREDRRAAMFLGGGCLIFFVIGMVMMIVTGILNAVEESNVNSIYGETFASTCQPMPAGQDSPDNIPDVSSPRQMLLLIADTQRRHPWHDDLPTQWQAATTDEVAIIGCVEEEKIEIETCEYSRDSARSGDTYTVRVSREQYQATLVLINAQNARRIDSQTIIGTEPAPCPEDDGEFGTSTQQGDKVEWKDFASWAEGFIF